MGCVFNDKGMRAACTEDASLPFAKSTAIFKAALTADVDAGGCPDIPPPPAHSASIFTGRTAAAAKTLRRMQLQNGALTNTLFVLGQNLQRLVATLHAATAGKHPKAH